MNIDPVALTSFRRSILSRSDSYKYTHSQQYPSGTEYVEAYFAPRGGKFSEATFFGLQMLLQEDFVGSLFNQGDLDFAREFYAEHFGNPDIFNYDGWKLMLDRFGGHLRDGAYLKAVVIGSRGFQGQPL